MKNNSPKEDKKKRILDFIENNSAKADFLHWILNNTEEFAFSEEDNWKDIKKGVLESRKLSYSLLRDYAVTLEDGKAMEEVLGQIIEETEDAEKTVHRLNFLSRFKKFSVAIGGVVLFLGLIKIVLSLLFIFSTPEFLINVSPSLRILGTVFAGVSGLAECLGGIFLIEV